MYLPDHFAEVRTQEIHRIIQTHPLGILIYGDQRQVDAEHIPFELDADAGEHGSLRAHVARANDVWKKCPTGTEVLVIFRGVDGYISPSWYPSKHETHRQVPTWNYEVVHVRGTIAIREDERFLRGLLARLTRHHEQSEPKPWKMGDAPVDYTQMMIQNVVGLEIQIQSVTAKRKLSQNRETTDRINAADTVKERGNTELADTMQKALGS